MRTNICLVLYALSNTVLTARLPLPPAYVGSSLSVSMTTSVPVGTSSSSSSRISLFNSQASSFSTSSITNSRTRSATGNVYSDQTNTTYASGSIRASSNVPYPSTAPIVPPGDCSALCSSLRFTPDLDVTPISCVAYTANSTITIEGGQAASQCGNTIQPELDICRVVISIQTSYVSQTYVEVWLPNGNLTSWNGRTMSTDNGALNGCVHYVDMQYVSGLGFAAIGDNGGHNSSAFDGSWMLHDNEEIVDWAARARHQSVAAGKQVVTQFYDRPPAYAYYIGCSTGGQQGMHSAQYYPDDFDGIIAGSSAADFNHLQDWSSRFVQFTGTGPSDDRFLSYDDWLTVQQAILDQCDEPLDHVPDGILEDPTICQFDSTVLACSTDSFSGCLSDPQVSTVTNVFSALFSPSGQLLYPAMLYGSEIDAWRLGQLDGSTQGLVHDFFAYGVYNTTAPFDPRTLNATDYARADALDALHGNVSSFTGDLRAFRAAGGKLLLYHGMADPLVSGANSQRYYLKVADALALESTQMDDFLRLFRISGMAHCGVGGISGAGAWMFGQTGAAGVEGVVDNIVARLVEWVENDRAPDVLVGTKFWWDLPELGVQFTRPHCRFPFRTTYVGGDWNETEAWNCSFIADWQECGVGALPRTCNVDGTFT